MILISPYDLKIGDTGKGIWRATERKAYPNMPFVVVRVATGQEWLDETLAECGFVSSYNKQEAIDPAMHFYEIAID